MNKIALTLVCFLMVPALQAAGDANAGKQKAASCFACHGADGNSPSGQYPSLAGQNEKYLVKQMKDFKLGVRTNPIMQGMIAPVSEDDFADIAAYFASQTMKKAPVEEKFLKAGEAIYRGGDAERKVPACIACHGPRGEGLASAGYPAIAGQHPEYTIAQLKAFRDGARTNDPNGMMRGATHLMSDKQMEAVAHYLVGLH
ncbi:MAG: cytochrome c4 [Gammaproteobacteria bacterium]|nr:MAG: cytochrome c4 [Gammaproteobacteria bacterium]